MILKQKTKWRIEEYPPFLLERARSIEGLDNKVNKIADKKHDVMRSLTLLLPIEVEWHSTMREREHFHQRGVVLRNNLEKKNVFFFFFYYGSLLFFE